MTRKHHIHHVGRIGRLLLALLLLACGLAPAAYADDEKGGPAYLKLDPVDFSVLSDDGRLKIQVSIQLALELEPGLTEATMRAYQPKIEDKILPILDTLWESEAPNAPVSVQQIKQVLTPAIIDVTGKDKILEVLVLDVREVRG
jgi:hypothetical protein